MALEFSRNLEEIIASRILMTSTEGFVDITALGKDGAGGVVSLNGNCLRMASEKSFLDLACLPDGSGSVSLRSTGTNGSILLSVPSNGKSARLTVCPGGIQLSFGKHDDPKTVEILDESIEISMGGKGGKVSLRDDSLVFEVGPTSLRLTPNGIESRCGEAVVQLVGGTGQQKDESDTSGLRE